MTQLPTRLPPQFQLAVQHHRNGQLAQALEIYTQLARQDPKNATVHGMIGAAQRGLGRLEEAHSSLERAIKLQPDNPQFRHDLALVYRLENRFDKAHESLNVAIRLNPNEATYLATKAELHYLESSVKTAMHALEPALQSGVYNNSVAVIFAKLSVPLGRQQEALKHLAACLTKFDLSPGMRGQLLYGAGDVLDSIGRYDDAMAQYRQANAIRFAGYDAAANTAAVDGMIRAWTRPTIAAAANSGNTDDRPILIVGMPRSGLSLVEQILASHPQVFGAGEQGRLISIARELPGQRVNFLPYQNDPAAAGSLLLQRVAIEYLTHLNTMNSVAKRITDRQPMNFLNLGMIQLLLPKARVIHCVRDPLDTCLSCYFQNFVSNLPFAFDLAAAGAFYRDYARLMNHWKQVLDLPILDVHYEELVDNQEAVSRRIVEFAGLEWDPACLEFHKTERGVLTAGAPQVRTPMFKTSKARHRNYESHLGPLRAALADHPAG